LEPRNRDAEDGKDEDVVIIEDKNASEFEFKNKSLMDYFNN